MEQEFEYRVSPVTDNVLRICEVKIGSFVVSIARGGERRPLWRVCH